MRFSEGVATDAGNAGAFGEDPYGEFTSDDGGTDWSRVPFSGSFAGRVWEGTDRPAPAGPWGIVELPPTGALDTLTEAVDTLELLNGLQCWADAQKARIVDRIRELHTHASHTAPSHRARDGSEDSPQEEADQDEFAMSLTAEEVGALLRLPVRSAKALVEQSRLMVQELPCTLASMEAGKLSWRHATMIADECLGVPAESLPEFEKCLVEKAEQSTVAKLGRHARGLREILHPEAAPVRKTRAVSERRIVLEPAADGMAWLSAYLPAEQASGIYNRIDAGARGLQSPDDARTLSQLRADVFADLLTHTCAGDVTGGTGFRGVGATVHVTVPALTLLEQMPGLGANEGPRGADVGGSGSRPGSSGTADFTEPANQQSHAILEGYGPIDPETAARLAAHAPSFTRILTHPETGAALSIGRSTYRPPKHLQDWVRIRDKTCRHPGCNRTASATEIDHTIPWHRGGPTDHSNLACLCKKHHMFKTNGHWDYMQPEPGTIVAVSPAGKAYTTKPPPF